MFATLLKLVKKKHVGSVHFHHLSRVLVHDLETTMKKSKRDMLTGKTRFGYEISGPTKLYEM